MNLFYVKYLRTGNFACKILLRDRIDLPCFVKRLNKLLTMLKAIR